MNPQKVELLRKQHESFIKELEDAKEQGSIDFFTQEWVPDKPIIISSIYNTYVAFGRYSICPMAETRKNASFVIDKLITILLKKYPNIHVDNTLSGGKIWCHLIDTEFTNADEINQKRLHKQDTENAAFRASLSYAINNLGDVPKPTVQIPQRLIDPVYLNKIVKELDDLGFSASYGGCYFYIELEPIKPPKISFWKYFFNN